MGPWKCSLLHGSMLWFLAFSAFSHVYQSDSQFEKYSTCRFFPKDHGKDRKDAKYLQMIIWNHDFASNFQSPSPHTPNPYQHSLKSPEATFQEFSVRYNVSDLLADVLNHEKKQVIHYLDLPSVSNLCLFTKKPTKRQKIYISRRSRYGLQLQPLRPAKITPPNKMCEGGGCPPKKKIRVLMSRAKDHDHPATFFEDSFCQVILSGVLFIPYSWRSLTLLKGNLIIPQTGHKELYIFQPSVSDNRSIQPTSCCWRTKECWYFSKKHRNTPLKFNSSPLKIDGCKTTFLLVSGPSNFSGAMLNFGSVNLPRYNISWRIITTSPTPATPNPTPRRGGWFLWTKN